MHITFIGHFFCNLSHVLKHFYIKPLAYFKCLNSFKKCSFLLLSSSYMAMAIKLYGYMHGNKTLSRPYITVWTLPGAITFALIIRCELRLRTLICWPLLPSPIAVPAILALTP